MRLSVYPHVGTLPSQIRPARMVVIDVLRATTTITTALAAGCPAIEPVRSIQEARARRRPGWLLAGERDGRPPADFDLGNSPLEMTRQRLAGQGLVLTTTNGTAALVEARAWGPVVCAAFANRTAVCDFLRQSREEVIILCSGQPAEGRPTWCAEDLCLAGALVDGLEGQPNDLARVAGALYREQRQKLTAFLRSTEHGSYLCREGFAADVDFCAGLDRVKLVPYFDQVVEPLPDPAG
jgi:2-phosphosulfolactate phosphatase